MSRVDETMVYSFIHAHCSRVAELLKPNEKYEHGGNLDGNTETEIIGHLHTLSLLSKKLDEVMEGLVQTSGGKD